jgi:hypothetical protein
VEDDGVLQVPEAPRETKKGILNQWLDLCWQTHNFSKKTTTVP